MFEGTLRVNKENAYVSVPELTIDIMIVGRKDRYVGRTRRTRTQTHRSNRTFDGDMVVVEVLHESKWRPVAAPGKRLDDDADNDLEGDGDDDDNASQPNSATSTPTKSAAPSPAGTPIAALVDEIATRVAALHLSPDEERAERVRKANSARDAAGRRLQPTALVVRVTGRVVSNLFVGRLVRAFCFACRLRFVSRASCAQRSLSNDLKPRSGDRSVAVHWRKRTLSLALTRRPQVFHSDSERQEVADLPRARRHCAAVCRRA